MSEKQDDRNILNDLFSVINKLILVMVLLIVFMVALPLGYYISNLPKRPKVVLEDAPAVLAEVKKIVQEYWIAPDVSTISDPTEKETVEYGRELIAHTSKYLGPNGSVMQISNGMNCQNCHLQAGTAVFANNYGSVASLYPKFRARSGAVENVEKRVNDCFERSLNGSALDDNSKEMKAIVAYINYLGTNVKKGEKAAGSGFKDLAFLDRAADPINGKAVYAGKCVSCHQPDGSGLLNPDKSEYTFPPLWGKNSYNDGAGLYRISNFAKYVKYNMPIGATHENPQLSDEEAWDIAAFVNSQARPHINVPKDWPDKSKKPIDHPFGPFADTFTEKQHKYGPFKPIAEEQKKREAAAALANEKKI
ncbi:thiosulfate dehydrogenase [Daejeonella rubra]|uniref:Thiosulfate dehydrogenase n=1 Tax=Daejeonella rubra TaxID=990371 RepID=A0A1G9V7D6_9SPHI|nr:c-type cytochrome [Daejeonella rubra]SDM67977.1 thiosulfate dehydrogenase [Daejeonella rubra]